MSKINTDIICPCGCKQVGLFLISGNTPSGQKINNLRVCARAAKICEESAKYAHLEFSVQSTSLLTGWTP
jgi:hypothetical protein